MRMACSSVVWLDCAPKDHRDVGPLSPLDHPVVAVLLRQLSMAEGQPFMSAFFPDDVVLVFARLQFRDGPEVAAHLLDALLCELCLVAVRILLLLLVGARVLRQLDLV
jgi:hypothetical protein